MEVTLNAQTTVTVTAKISEFNTTTKKGQDFMYVRNDKIYGARVTTKKWFAVKFFLLFVLAGLLGGLGHYLYDTAVLGYDPNPVIIGSIFLGLSLIGVAVSFRTSRILELVLDSNQSPSFVTYEVGKEANEGQLEDLVDIIVN